MYQTCPFPDHCRNRCGRACLKKKRDFNVCLMGDSYPRVHDTHVGRGQRVRLDWRQVSALYVSGTWKDMCEEKR